MVYLSIHTIVVVGSLFIFSQYYVYINAAMLTISIFFVNPYIGKMFPECTGCKAFFQKELIKDNKCPACLIGCEHEFEKAIYFPVKIKSRYKNAWIRKCSKCGIEVTT